MAALNLGQLIQLVQQQADIENDPNISTTEITSYLNQSALEWYDLLVAAYGEDYFFTTPDYWFTSTGGTDLFPFPDGTSTYKLSDGQTTAPAVYKAIGVDVSTANGGPGTWVTLYPFNVAERNQFSIQGQAPYLGMSDIRFRFRGNNVWFNIMPAGNQTFRLLYVPQLSPLVANGDTLADPAGWSEYVVVDAAIKCLGKQERDNSELKLRKADLKRRIEAMRANRLTGHPKTVQRVRRNQFGYDAPWQGGRGPFGSY